MGFPEQFPHRHNADNSYDSTCRECLVTVATAAREIDLREFEARHVCDPWRAYRLSQGYVAREATFPSFR
jgi:hypothetical protein